MELPASVNPLLGPALDTSTVKETPRRRSAAGAAVVAASVLEYVRDPAAVLAECARVLRPGGALLCTVPNAAHPVRWLEWPLCLAARARLARIACGAPNRSGQYLTYLRTSRQRRRVRWWHATARRAGLEPAPVWQAAREPLRLLAFTRPGAASGHRFDTMRGKQWIRQ